MMVYVVATLLSCLAAFAYERRRRWLCLTMLAAVPLLLVSAARWNVGTDFRRTYLPEYRALEQMRGTHTPPQDVRAFRYLARRHLFGRTPQRVCRHFKKVLRRSEPAYRLLMEASLWSGLGFRAVVAVCSAMVAACVFCAIFRFSRWPTLAVFLYVATGNYFLSLNIMRQYVAIGVGLLSVGYVLDRRPWRFMACVAVAMSFHYSAVLLLPLYALSRIELTPRRGVAVIAAAFAFSLVAEPAVLGVLRVAGAHQYSKYFFSRLASDGFEWMFFAINCCFLAMGAWYWRGAAAGSRFFAAWYGMTVLGTAALAVSGAVPLMKRVNYYYAAPQFLMLPEILLAESNPCRRRILTALVVAAFAAETAVSVFVLNKNGVLPYRWSSSGW